jgi:hypothetical protein
MFIVPEEVVFGDDNLPLKSLLAEFLALTKQEQLLTRNDPFLIEAQCALEALEYDSEPEES